MNKCLVAGILVCAVAAILGIVSVAIPYWLFEHDNAGGIESTVAMGLWKRCSKYTTHSSTQTSCKTINASDWLKAVQALMILGVLFLVTSTLLACAFSKYDSKKYLYLGTVFTAVLGGIAIIVAVVVFGAKERELRANLSAGFYLAIASGVLSLAAAILIAVSKTAAAGYNKM